MTSPLTETDTIRAKVARNAWTCGAVTLARVAQEMGITVPSHEDKDAGRPWSPVLHTAEESYD